MTAVSIGRLNSAVPVGSIAPALESVSIGRSNIALVFPAARVSIGRSLKKPRNPPTPLKVSAGRLKIACPVVSTLNAADFTAHALDDEFTKGTDLTPAAPTSRSYSVPSDALIFQLTTV